MKSRWLLWLVAVLIGTALAFPPAISAAEKKAAQPCAPAMEKKEEPKAMSATGQVVSVDAKAGMLAVKVKDKEMSFTATAKALEKVKVGQLVTVSYTEQAGQMKATSVKAAKAPVKKAEAKKK